MRYQPARPRQLVATNAKYGQVLQALFDLIRLFTWQASTVCAPGQVRDMDMRDLFSLCLKLIKEIDLESNEQGLPVLGSNFGPCETSIPRFIPSSSSSYVTSYPRRGSLTPEQRELKRQRDQVRRDSKASVRAHRASSNPYMSSPPASLPDTPPSMGMPVYNAAPSSSSLLTDSTTAVPTSSYVSSYNPSLLDQTAQSSFQSTYDLRDDYIASFQPPPQYS